MGFEWLPAKNYKRHYICTDCQKGFKRASEEDMKHPKSSDISNLMETYYALKTNQDIVAFIQESYRHIAITCPQCNEPMQQVAYTFEVPAKRDTKAWKKLKGKNTKPYINVDTHIHWHKIQLQKGNIRAEKKKSLEENLKKLIR